MLTAREFITTNVFTDGPNSNIQNALLGNHILVNTNLIGLDGQTGSFFIFSDLSVRLKGVYRLRFSLIDVAAGGNGTNISDKGGRVIQHVYSDAFKVVEPKEYSGLMGWWKLTVESTTLTKCLSRQGIKLPVRNYNLTTNRRRVEDFVKEKDQKDSDQSQLGSTSISETAPISNMDTSS
jgi:Velvet factor